MIEVVDALGRTVHLAAPARRVVSLVPSETHAVMAMAGAERVVGRSRYCEHTDAPFVGGTKDVDLDAVVARAPDLVLANQEENARKGVEALIAAGLTVHVSFPRSLEDSAAYLDTLGVLLAVDSPGPRLRALLGAPLATRRRVFVPIWNDPWMTFDGRAFASDVLDACGLDNVFSDRPRRYPLGADLGTRPPLPPERVGDRDTRYPRIRLEEAVARTPDLVLLPDEPHDFTDEDVDAMVAAGLRRETIHRVSGKDLFWYGAWPLEALPRLRA